MNNKTDAQLAALVHPQFKLYWLSDEVQKAWLVTTSRIRIDAIIKEEDKKLGGKISDNQTMQPEAKEFSINFFTAFSNKSQRSYVVGVEEVDR